MSRFKCQSNKRSVIYTVFFLLRKWIVFIVIFSFITDFFICWLRMHFKKQSWKRENNVKDALVCPTFVDLSTFGIVYFPTMFSFASIRFRNVAPLSQLKKNHMFHSNASFKYNHNKKKHTFTKLKDKKKTVDLIWIQN